MTGGKNIKSYDVLIAAAIYRDGGSLEARFRFSDGTFESLWLGVIPWDHPAQISYGPLKQADNETGAEHGRVIEKKSPDDQRIVATIRAFLEQLKLDIAHRYHEEESHFIEIVVSLLKEISLRLK